MQYRIIFVFFLLVLMSCGQAGKVPEGVLPKDQMRDIMLEMIMADAYSNDNPEPGKPLPDSIRKERVKLYYKQILDLHHLSLAEWQKSYTWYEGRPDRMKEVYDGMMEKATANREELDVEMRMKTYKDDPYSALPFGNQVLILKKVLPTPFLTEVPKPAPHQPAPPKPQPQPQKVDERRNQGPVPLGSGPTPDKGELLKAGDKKLKPLDLKKDGPMGRHKPDFTPKQ